MFDFFVSFFVIAALALIFARAWNLVAETTLQTYEKRDSDGNVIEPVKQTIAYAVCVTLVSVIVIWYIHYHTKIDLTGRRK